MKRVYMVIGKSYVCNRLTDKFDYVRHDDAIGGNYVQTIVQRSKAATKPMLIETPFSISQIKEPLEKRGFEIVPVFIQEKPEVIAKRYKERDGKDIPAGHLKRQQTYEQRANEYGAFKGTSDQVLEHLKTKGKMPWE